MKDDRIERNEQDSNLTTADLARSAEDAESEERTKEKLRDNSTPGNRPDNRSDNRNIPVQNRDAGRTDVGAGAKESSGVAQWTTSNTTGAATAATPARESEYARLFSESDAKGFRARWENLQVGFVDEPRHSVEQADSLVAEAIKRLAEVFAEERQKLEGQWDRGGNVSTEDLRLALQRYRAFFGRLLSV